jgi:maltose-binding protein MalE
MHPIKFFLILIFFSLAFIFQSCGSKKSEDDKKNDNSKNQNIDVKNSVFTKKSKKIVKSLKKKTSHHTISVDQVVTTLETSGEDAKKSLATMVA